MKDSKVQEWHKFARILKDPYMKKPKQEQDRYYVVYREDGEFHCVTYFDKDELIDAIADTPDGPWDGFEFVEDPYGLNEKQACIIKGTVVVPKITRRAVEVEIE